MSDAVSPAGKGTPGTSFHEEFLSLLQRFANQLSAKMQAAAAGEPEDQLKPPVDALLTAFGNAITRTIVLKGETLLKERLGRPDFAVHDAGLLVGYIELKAPGKGAVPERYKGHDKEQWERFKALPNLVYTDGNEWCLYRFGVPSSSRVRLDGDAASDGEKAVSKDNAIELFELLADFINWTPIVPSKPKELAEFLAPFCGLIRGEVLDGLRVAGSPLHKLQDEIRTLLFPDANQRQFADAYAQTVIFALLLAQLEGADVLDLTNAFHTLESHHLLLSRALQFLTDRQVREEISASLAMAQRVIHEVDTASLTRKTGVSEDDVTYDPWLFFYEHFLAKYDPDLRKKWGVYYTPVEVVRCQVRLIDEILVKHMGKDMGFVEPGVITLDPALGTGTYLMGIIEHALEKVAREEGPGAVKGGARSLVNNLYGFEWMVGPYAVAQVRFTRVLTEHGATLPPAGPGIFLTNTLESPHTRPPMPSVFHEPIASEHKRALKVKDADHVLICLGNPPYGRHEAASKDNKAITGGWVRYGGDNESPILEDFLSKARKTGRGVHLKNLYNHYVYFIRWALWKVFEHTSATGPGIVSFITASSYLDGDAFVGLREHLRKECEHIDIIDLGGEGRGTRKTANVFAIQTPVAIFVAWRKGRKANREIPAQVRYASLSGSREEKLDALSAIKSQDDLKWQVCPKEWQAPFRPVIKSGFGAWPQLTEIFPWQQSGVEVKRSWPIGPEKDVLARRWQILAASEDKQKLFKETRDRKVSARYAKLNSAELHEPILDITPDEKLEFEPYAFRTLDRQWIILDNRVGDYLRPVLWRASGKQQTFFTSLFNHPLGRGPALTVCASVPDRHHFRGSYGGKDVLPLYRGASKTSPNMMPGLLELLTQEYGHRVSPEDVAGYVYALLAHPGYTERFCGELESRNIHVPLTRKKDLFVDAAEFGKRLIWLHTYGQRMTSADRPAGVVPKGAAKCIAAVSGDESSYPREFCHDGQTLSVGEGRFEPVTDEVFNFEVSGLKVVRSWLGYRMLDRSGKKSSPLDKVRPQVWTHEFTRELLELLWVLEATIAGYPAQAQLLHSVLDGELFTRDELPVSTPDACKAPKIPRVRKDQETLPDVEI